MTTPTLSEAATVRELLFGAAGGDPVDQLETSLRQSGALRNLPGMPDVLQREVAKATNELLSTGLVDAVAAGWKRYEALRAAARRTLALPTSKETVVLATHRIDFSQHPTIELYVDGRSVADIALAIGVTFDVEGVAAVVRQGRLVAIESGTCTVTGDLTIHGVSAAHRERCLDLPGAVSLRRGIALLSADDSAATVSRPVGGAAEPPGADWYPDPTRRYQYRWWNGTRWTSRVATNRREASDPVASERLPRPIRQRADAASR